MDPNAAFREMVRDVLCEDWVSAQEYAIALSQWLDSDGFVPQLTREQLRSIARSVELFADQHLQ